jgi:hypothetical protein
MNNTKNEFALKALGYFYEQELEQNSRTDDFTYPDHPYLPDIPVGTVFHLQLPGHNCVRGLPLHQHLRHEKCR